MDASTAARHAAVAAVLRAIVADKRPTRLRGSLSLSPSAASTLSPSPSPFSAPPTEARCRAAHPSAGRSTVSPSLLSLSSHLAADLPDGAESADGIADAVQVWGELADLNREEEVALWQLLLERLQEIEASVTPTEQVIILDALARLPPQLLFTSVKAHGAEPAASPSLFCDRVHATARRLMGRMAHQVSVLPVAALAVILRAAAVLDVPHAGLLGAVSVALQSERNSAPFEDKRSLGSRAGHASRAAGCAELDSGAVGHQREQGNSAKQREAREAETGTALGRAEQGEGRGDLGNREEHSDGCDRCAERGDGKRQAEAGTREDEEESTREQHLGGRGICAVVYGHLALNKHGFAFDPIPFLQQFLSPQVCATLSPTRAAALATYGRHCLEAHLAGVEDPHHARKLKAIARRSDERDRDTRQLRGFTQEEPEMSRVRLLCALTPLVHRLLQIQSGRTAPSSAAPSSPASALLCLGASTPPSASLFSSLLSLTPTNLNRPWYTHLAMLEEEPEDRGPKAETQGQTTRPFTSLFSPGEVTAAAAFACAYLVSFQRLRRMPKGGACDLRSIDACTLKESGSDDAADQTRGSGGGAASRRTGEADTGAETFEERGQARVKPRQRARGSGGEGEATTTESHADEDACGLQRGAEESSRLLRSFAEALPSLLGRMSGADAAAIFSGLHRLGCLDTWTAEALADVMERELNRTSPATQRHSAPWGARRPGLPTFWSEERLAFPLLLHDALHFLEAAVAGGILCRRSLLLHALAANLAREASSLSEAQKRRLVLVCDSLGLGVLCDAAVNTHADCPDDKMHFRAVHAASDGGADACR
ncbi:conserved hypothetical protein [Neospora caninum Liverpool]|nr:conserved hypothetical protein [Neospora caninum Liverpool]CBZ53538.1 conserved hypothetical protein [Neospora caninum Liverpool]|eukprot:XP_003883570.1 conserved hypothetical protein [Neospora caninum Liverpool]